MLDPKLKNAEAFFRKIISIRECSVQSKNILNVLYRVQILWVFCTVYNFSECSVQSIPNPLSVLYSVQLLWVFCTVYKFSECSVQCTNPLSVLYRVKIFWMFCIQCTNPLSVLYSVQILWVFCTENKFSKCYVHSGTENKSSHATCLSSLFVLCNIHRFFSSLLFL